MTILTSDSALHRIAMVTCDYMLIGEPDQEHCLEGLN